MMSFNIIAVIPCFNEEKSIFNIVTKTSKHVSSVIVVDDGSTDNTYSEAARAGALVLKHTSKKGKGSALNSAFQFLRSQSGDAAVVLDGDGQHDPDEIPKIIKQILVGNSDIVIGSRFLSFDSKIPAYRKLGQIVLNIASNIGSGVIVTDSQSGYRAFSKKAIEFMIFLESGFSVESEMQFIAKKHKLVVSEVPICTKYCGAAKCNPFKHGFSVLFRVISLSGRYFLENVLSKS